MAAAMRKFAKWHIWLAWLTGFPILMWVVTGLFMVAKPIEEVRGSHLVKEATQENLPRDITIAVNLPAEWEKEVRSVSSAMEGGEVITRIRYADGSSDRIREDGSRIGPLSELEARLLVAERIEGGDKVASTQMFEADKVPFDFRRPMPVWQVALEDGTHVYVGTETGRLEAVRTRWWRGFDFMWGLHIMDLETRELDGQSAFNRTILLVFSALSVIASLLGVFLMFRRRKARASTPAPEEA